MNGKTMIVIGGALITAVITIASILFERRRYLTNNPNVARDDFNVHPDPICPICRELMDTDGPTCSLLHCGHFLHSDCLRSMNEARDLLQTNRCPTCRTPFRYS